LSSTCQLAVGVEVSIKDATRGALDLKSVGVGEVRPVSRCKPLRVARASRPGGTASARLGGRNTARAESSAVTGDKDKRDLAGGKRFGDRIYLLAVEVDVEKGDIQRLPLGHLHCPVETSDRPDNLEVKLGKHLLQEERNHDFILD
jgi:hypothetical protein